MKTAAQINIPQTGRIELSPPGFNRITIDGIRRHKRGERFGKLRTHQRKRR